MIGLAPGPTAVGGISAQELLRALPCAGLRCCPWGPWSEAFYLLKPSHMLLSLLFPFLFLQFVPCSEDGHQLSDGGNVSILDPGNQLLCFCPSPFSVRLLLLSEVCGETIEPQHDVREYCTWGDSKAWRNWAVQVAGNVRISFYFSVQFVSGAVHLLTAGTPAGLMQKTGTSVDVSGKA